MTGDVFEEDPFRLDLADDPGDLWPQVSLVVCAAPLSGLGKRLAGVASEDGVERPSEWPSVEGGDIIPDRGGGEVSGPLSGDDGLPGVVLNFHPAQSSEAWFGKVEPQVKAASSTTQAKAVRWSGR